MRKRNVSFLTLSMALLWFVGDVSAQQLTGRVVATTGQPLAAVQVFIAGSGIGALTQQNGRYLLLNVPAGTHTVTAERIGFQTMTSQVTVTAGETALLDFTLSEQALGLDEIVVTGVPGGTRRRAIGNAVTTMNVAARLETQPVRNVDDLLTGRTPGVTVMGMGSVGMGGNIRIRGQSTFSLSPNPLVYIDGVRVSNAEDMGLFDDAGGGRSMLGTIDPSEIESIEVLKGPSAATLYGTEASRGVIQIITKKGQQGGRTVSMMIRQGTNFVGPNALDIIGGVRYGKNAVTGQIEEANILKHWQDQEKDPFGYGHAQEYNLSVSGGTPDVRYFMSSSYLDEEGYLSTNWVKRFNLRGNIEGNLGENLRVQLSTGYTQTSDRRPREGAGNVTGAFVFGGPRFLPENFCLTRPSDVCGNTDGLGTYGLVGITPTQDESVLNTQALNRFVGSATTSWDPLSWLSSRLILGVDYTGEAANQTVEFQTDPASRAAHRTRADGWREILRIQRVVTTVDLSSTAEFGLTQNLLSTTAAGFQYYAGTTRSMFARGDGFPAPGLKVIDAARATSLRRATDNRNSILSDNLIENRTLGTYLQQTLAWRDRLFLTGAVRVDNNSAFGSEVQFVTYPKASLSWVVNDEDWFNVSWLDALRLRIAYGQSGEQPPAFSALRTYTPVPSPVGGGVTTFTLGNPDLRPEVGEEIETGFDAGLFGGRLGLEFTYYNTRTKDAILDRPTPPSSGFSEARFINAGQVTSKGVEFSIDAQAVAKAGFRWNLGAHVAYNSASIDRISDDPADTVIIYGIWNLREHRVGREPHAWFGPKLVSAEWDPIAGSIVNEMCKNGSGGTMPCYDAQSVMVAPRLYLGRTIAPWEIGASSEFAFGEQLRLNVQVVSNLGHQRFDNNMRQRYGGFANTRANHFPEEASPRELLRLAAAKSGDAIMSPFVNDVSFTRLQEVALSWALPRERVEGFGISGATLSVAGRNLWTWTDWEDIDPTVSRPKGDDRQFFSQHMLPTPTTVETVLRVTF